MPPKTLTFPNAVGDIHHPHFIMNIFGLDESFNLVFEAPVKCCILALEQCWLIRRLRVLSGANELQPSNYRFGLLFLGSGPEAFFRRTPAPPPFSSMNLDTGLFECRPYYCERSSPGFVAFGLKLTNGNDPYTGKVQPAPVASNREARGLLDTVLGLSKGQTQVNLTKYVGKHLICRK